MTTSSAGRRRNWKATFSLRSLFIATLLCGCGFGWIVSEMRRGRQQRAAVLRIRSLGGHANYYYQLNSIPNGKGKYQTPEPRWFRAFVGNEFLCHVRSVSWHAVHANNRDLEALSHLAKLKDLRLNARQITDAGLQHLQGLSSLDRLDLWCPQVTDQGLLHLASLKSLEKLDLLGTQVTDAGLIHLRGLKNLRELKVRKTRVTAKGAADLERALPGCSVLGVASHGEL